jgi:hypothetical protein
VFSMLSVPRQLVGSSVQECVKRRVEPEAEE